MLLCATDPGGAANLGPLVAETNRRGRTPIVVTTRGLASRFAGAAHIHTHPETPLADLVDEADPEAIVCGTTRYESPDRRLIPLAIARCVRVTAGVDERYGYRQRFADADDAVIWPDVITILDRASHDEAVAEGLPGDRLVVTGSAALAATLAAAREFAAAPPPRPDVLGSGDVPVVVFLSETIAADYGTAPDEQGPMGPFIGYTEHGVLEQLVEALSQIGRPIRVIEKHHPAATRSEGAGDYSRGSVAVRQIHDVPLWPLLWHATAVVGMRSISLLECALLDVPAISFQPGLLDSERCTAGRLGLIGQARAAAAVAAWVHEQRGARGRGLGSFEFAPPDAAARIMQVALEDSA